MLPYVIFLVAFLFCSCNPLSKYDSIYHKSNQLDLGNQFVEGNYSIVVLHSYNELGQEGRYFRNLMDCCYKRHGVSAEVHHIYLDLLHNDDPFVRQYGTKGGNSLTDSIFSFKPDVLLINDDPAFDCVLEKHDTLVRTVPTVFAGVSAADFDRSAYPLLTGFRDPIDLAANCNLLKTIYGIRHCVVEIDSGGYQNVIRKQLEQNISDTTLFLNNSKFGRRLDDMLGTADNMGRLSVAFVSMADPSANRPDGTASSVGQRITQRIKSYSSAGAIGHIQVKYDIFSNGFLDLNSRPQVTAIREQFSNNDRSNNERRSDRSYDFKRTKFLCGYFASLETQIVDQIHYSLRILQGEDPLIIPIENHQKEFLMDWNAMQLMSPKLEYSDYREQFEIVNVPFSESHTILFHLIVSVSILGLLFLLVFPVFLNYRKKSREHSMTLAKLQEESKYRLLVLEDTESVFMTIFNGRISYVRNPKNEFVQKSWPLTKFRELFVDPESYGSFDVCMESSVSDGRKSKVRVKANLLGHGWHWWEMTFSRCEDNGMVTGFAVNIDKTIEYEASLKESAQRAEEVASKENFIANITHDIRTPLNAISGFAQLLAEGCSHEERCLYSELIKDNSGQLLNLIDEAVRKPSDSVDSMSFKMRTISTAKLLDDSYHTNRILCPSHLDFLYEPYSGPDVSILADSVRTTQVINNFLSNAFKYTLNGSVTLGWSVIDKENCIEVYVADTGIGISESDAKIVEKRFSTVKGNYKGTGLGLDICRTIIEKQNGKYGFSSQLGKGSRFWFRLPIDKPQQNPEVK